MKNRMRGIRTSGSVGDGDGNIPIYPAMTPLTRQSAKRCLRFRRNLSDDLRRGLDTLDQANALPSPQ